MKIDIVPVSDELYVINSVPVTVYRDMEGAVVTNPLISLDALKALKKVITEKYKKVPVRRNRELG